MIQTEILLKVCLSWKILLPGDLGVTQKRYTRV